jgi:ketosteroid isomerase-like protein
MTLSNVETVRDALRVLAEDGVEPMIPMIHPEFEMTTPIGLAAEPQTYRGRDGVRRWFSSFDEVMDDVRVEADFVEELADGRMLAETTVRATGPRSGIVTEQHTAMLLTVADGMVRRIEFYPDTAAARAAVRA